MVMAMPGKGTPGSRDENLHCRANNVLREFQKIDADTQCGAAVLGRIARQGDGACIRRLAEVCQCFQRRSWVNSTMLDLPESSHPHHWEWYLVILSKITISAPQNSEAFFNGVVQGSMWSLNGWFDWAAA